MPKLNINKREVMQRILDETNLDELLLILDQLDNETRNLVLKAISKRLDVNGKARVMVAIREAIRGRENAIKNWIVTAVSNSYASGANVMYADIKKLKIDAAAPAGVVQQAFTADMIRRIDLLTIHKDAINALVSDTYLDFANGMNGLVRGAERQLNEAIKKQIRAINISKQITGTDLRTIAKEVEEVIGKQGFNVLIDRGGRKWELKTYARMLTRTHTIKAANEGVINRALDYNVDLVQVSTHGGACDICKPFEGKIYSISGKSKKFPPLVEQPPYHPNCRHSLLPRPFIDS